MTNPHIAPALKLIKFAEQWQCAEGSTEATEMANLLIAQTEATLAVAYELRTANLIAMWSHPESSAHQSTLTLADVTLKDLLQRSLERLDTQADGTVAP